MTHDSLDEQPEKTPESSELVTETAEPAAPVLAAAEAPSWTAERVVDVTLGLASVAAEAAGDAIQRLSVNAKALQENAPAIREALEERGRPIREQLVNPDSRDAADEARERRDAGRTQHGTGIDVRDCRSDHERTRGG